MNENMNPGMAPGTNEAKASELPPRTPPPAPSVPPFEERGQNAEPAENPLPQKNMLWAVKDTTCVAGHDQHGRPLERTHQQLVDGMVKSYTFVYEKETMMPEEEARKFVKTEAFIVLDHNHNRVLPSVPIDRGVGERVRLGVNEAVARFDELTTSALVSRVSSEIGGERFTRNHNREELIDFLMQSRARRNRAVRGVPEDPDTAEMPRNELDSLVPMGEANAHAERTAERVPAG